MGISESAVARSLFEGIAFADLSFWRKVAVTGAEASTWLNDLVSADISELRPGRARQALLLSPTGRLRAEFTVTSLEGSLLLLQDPIQANPIGELLSPYVLSSQVSLEDRTDRFVLLAFPGMEDPPLVSGAAASSPSCLGGGSDLIGLISDRDPLLAELGAAFVPAGQEEVEAWRILAGRPKVGVDVTEEDLPQDVGLESAVSFEKGCYLGQESMARVSNLGHPRRSLLHLYGEGQISPGDIVLAEDGREVGQVTSATLTPGGTVVLAKVGWSHREARLRVAEIDLEPFEL